MENRDLLAPVCLFVYVRINETQKTVEALKSNFLASESELFIFSDGGRTEEDVKKVKQMREYLSTIDGFKSVNITESKVNKGLANSVIDGVTSVLNKYGKVIVMEDDLISTPDFLNFLNQSLDYYENNPKVFNISGYSFDLPTLINYGKDFYTGYRASSWGWGTWKDRWDKIEWSVEKYKYVLMSPLKKIKFMRGGSDMPHMLWRQMNGKIDSWAIRWCYHQFKNDLLTVFPSKTKIVCIGIGADATNTKKTKRFDVCMDTNLHMKFNFDQNIVVNKHIAREFRHKFSLISRIKDRF